MLHLGKRLDLRYSRRLWLLQTSDSTDGRTISSLVFEQTSLSLFDMLRTMVALIAVASVAIAAIVYLIVGERLASNPRLFLWQAR